jgi:hypothetical protein
MDQIFIHRHGRHERAIAPVPLVVKETINIGPRNWDVKGDGGTPIGRCRTIRELNVSSNRGTVISAKETRVASRDHVAC